MANTGRSFEIEVRDFIEVSLKAGQWGFDPKCCVVRSRAKYWSDKRESNIIVDVSVEIRKPKEKEYWLLWVIECKDIRKLVPVDDVEEFHCKMTQIKAHKGTVVSRLGFGTGCTAFAKNSKIGLIRLTPSGPKLVLNERYDDAPTPLDFVEGARSSGCPAVSLDTVPRGWQRCQSQSFSLVSCGPCCRLARHNADG